jgi:hypothetical protein
MDSKKLIFSTLGSFILMFFMGYLWYAVLMKDFYMKNAGTATGVGKEMPDMPFLALGVLIFAFAMAYLYPKWSRGVNNAKQGYIFGALIGLILFGINFIQLATSNITTMTAVVVDGFYHVFIEQALAGVVIALIYGKTKEE